MYIESRGQILDLCINHEFGIGTLPNFCCFFSEPEIFRRQSLRSDQSVQHLWGHHEKAPQFQGGKKTISPTNHISSKYSIYKDGDLASRYPTGLRRLGQVPYILSLSLSQYNYIYAYIYVLEPQYIYNSYIYIYITNHISTLYYQYTLLDVALKDVVKLLCPETLRVASWDCFFSPGLTRNWGVPDLDIAENWIWRISKWGFSKEIS